MLQNKNKGRITINIESDNEKLNSTMERRGIAKKTDIALTSLLVNFASFSIKQGKNPKELIDKHLEGIIEMILEKGKQ